MTNTHIYYFSLWIAQGFTESPVTYTSWLVYGMPIAIINFLFVFFWLVIYYIGFRWATGLHDKLFCFAKINQLNLQPNVWNGLTSSSLQLYFPANALAMAGLRKLDNWKLKYVTLQSLLNWNNFKAYRGGTGSSDVSISWNVYNHTYSTIGCLYRALIGKKLVMIYIYM